MLGNDGRKYVDDNQGFYDLNENYRDRLSLGRNEKPSEVNEEYCLPPEESTNLSNPLSSTPDEAPGNKLQDDPDPIRRLKCEEAQECKVETPMRSTEDVGGLNEGKDIFTRFDENWANSVLEMNKWTNKKQALEVLNYEADCWKLAEKSPLALVTLAKRLMFNSNADVMLLAVRLIGLLAKGQRRFFEPYAKDFFPIFLGKLKDKKMQVIQETYFGLDCLLHSVSLEQVAEDIKAALEDKAATLRINVTLWLIKIYVTLSTDQLSQSVKPISILLKKNIDDSSAEVRSETLTLLSILYKNFPEIISETIKDLRLDKINKIKGSIEESSQEEVPEKKKPFKIGKEVKVGNRRPEKQLIQKHIFKKEVNKIEEERIGLFPAEEAVTILSLGIESETLEEIKETNLKE